MPSYNRVTLVGNVTRDSELKHLQSGTAVCNNSLAINDRRKGKDGEWAEETTFVELTLWNKTAEVAANYVKKGDPILVEGRLRQESWEKDGQKRSKITVTVDRLVMLGNKGSGDGRHNAPRSETPDEGPPTDGVDF